MSPVWRPNCAPMLGAASMFEKHCKDSSQVRSEDEDASSLDTNPPLDLEHNEIINDPKEGVINTIDERRESQIMNMDAADKFYSLIFICLIWINIYIYI